jgi:hypothetical protein
VTFPPVNLPGFKLTETVCFRCACRAIIVTTSSNKDRLERYLAAGDIHLTDAQVEAIDKAGAKGERDDKRKQKALTVAKYALLGGLGVWSGFKLSM